MRFTVIVPQLVSIEEKTDIVYEEIVCSQWHNKKHLIVLIALINIISFKNIAKL